MVLKIKKTPSRNPTSDFRGIVLQKDPGVFIGYAPLRYFVLYSAASPARE
jgi:hypothetical protein